MSAISSSFASLSLAALANAPAPAAAASPAVDVVKPAERPAAASTVQTQPGQNLSSLVQTPVFQEVQQLYRDGRTVPQIAFSLELSAQAVNSYLNISKS